MAKKSNLLKNLFATASAVAVLTCGAQNAAATALNTTGNVAALAVGGGHNLDNGGNFANGDTITLGGNHSITTGGDITIGAAGIADGGNAGNAFTTTHNVTIPGVLQMNVTVNPNGAILGGAGTDIAGTLTINSNAPMSTVNNVTGAVTLTAGNLTMGNATAAGADVTVTAGELTEIGTIGRHLLVNGGTVVKFGDVTGNVTTAGAALITGVGGAGNVGGTLTINTTNGGLNKVGNVAGAVTLTAGNLHMGNATAAGADVTVTAGELTEIGTIGRHLLVNGGTVVKFGDVTGNVATDNGALITGVGGAGNVDGTLTINTTNGGLNKVGNVAGAVTLTAGNLHMGNATAAGADVTVDNGATLQNVGTIGRHLILTGGTVNTLGNVTGEVQFNGANASTINTNVNAAEINFDDNNGNGTITGNITGGVNFKDKTDATLTFGGETFTGNTKATAQGKGIVVFNKATGKVTVNGTMGTDGGNQLKELQFSTGTTFGQEGVVFTQNVDADLYKFMTQTGVEAQGSIKGANSAADVDFNGQENAAFSLGAGDVGAIDGNAAGGGSPSGVFAFEGSHNVLDKVGENQFVNFLILDKDTGGAGVIDFKNEVKAINLTLNNNQAKFTTAGANYELRNVSSGANGKLSFERNMTFANGSGGAVNFGIVNARIGEIEIVGDNNIAFNNAHIYATTLRPQGANNHGNLKFTGTNNILDVTTLQGAADPQLRAITIGDGAAGTLQINRSMRINETITIHNASELIIGDDVTALTVGDNATAGKGIVANNDGDGTIRFRNTGELTVTGHIGDSGGNKAISNLILENPGIVKLASNDLKVNTITFNAPGDDGVDIDIGNRDIAGFNFVNNKPAIIDNGIFTSVPILNINTAFGSADNRIGGIVLTNPANQVVNVTNANFFGGITPASGQNGLGTVNVNVPDSNLLTLGLGGRRLNIVNINQNTTIAAGLFSNTVNVAATKKLEVTSGSLDMTTLNLNGADAHAVLKAGTDVNFDIRTATNDTGKVDFGGAKNINKTIGAAGGRLNTVCFDAGGKANIVKFDNANIFAKNVKFNNGTYQLATDTQIDGGLQFNGGSAMNLGTSKLTLKNGTSSFQGALEITTRLNAAGTAIGQIAADPGTGNELRFASLDSLVINVDDSQVAVSNASSTFDFLKVTSGSVADPDKVSKFSIKNSDTSFSKWDLVHEDGAKTIKLRRSNQTGSALAQSLKNANIEGGLVGQDTLDFLSDVAPGSQAEQYNVALSQMTDANRGDAIVRTANAGGTAGQQVVGDTVTSVGSTISNRVSSVASPAAVSVTTPGGAGGSKADTKVSENSSIITGIGAGDNADKYGVWFSPFFEDATQKKRSSTAGYKSQSVGATVGFDVMANEDIIVGAAATYVNTDLKYKDFKRGDKTKVESMLGSLYGLWQLAEQYYVQGSATFGSSKINNNELRRVSNTAYQTAHGKNTSMSFSGELIGGYNHVINNQFVVTPHAGFGIAKINDSSYKESGTTNQNLEINKKSSAKVNLILGLRATTTPYYFNDVAITPEVHAIVRHDLRGDQSKVEVIMDRGVAGKNNVLSKKAPKTNKTHYNLGAGVNAGYSSYDYGVSYDAIMSSKYVAHQGSLKIRVNF